MTFVDILKDLNPQQTQAVTAGDGAILVLAGPGSGKTRVLTRRIAYLISNRGINPFNILAVTFTNKAAREMDNRVQELINSDPKFMMIGTFHSVCARLLRREAQFVGLTQDYTIYDEDDQVSLVKRAMREMNIDDKINRPASVLSAISRAKNDMIDADKIEVRSYKDQVVQRVFKRYQELLLSCNAVDFDDLLLLTAKLLRDFPVVREKYAQRFQQVLVDEFQDTNLAQYELLKQLASIHKNIFVVGDEDQSIYRWRGADYHNVLRFEKDYPAHQKILLEQNYRSTQTILNAARAVIDHNPNRTMKRLRSDRGDGERIIYFEASDDKQEAEYVVSSISEMVSSRRAEYSDFAIMYRTNAMSRLLEGAFVAAGIPYRLVGAQRFYGRREVKDCIAYLRLIHNLSDDNSLERIINVPLRGIGDKTLLNLREQALQKKINASAVLLDLAKSGEQSTFWREFGGSFARKLADFGSQLQDWIDHKEILPLPKLFSKVLTDIDYRAYLESDGEEGIDRWENVEELLRVAFEFETQGMTAFLENIALVADQDTLPERPDAPTLLTLHASKGLEFRIVFIVGLDEKVLPHSRSFDDPEEMSEERRLFYVGITRTKDKLHLVRADNRGMYGGYDYTDPSRFLKDIPAELINSKAKPGFRTSRNSDWSQSSSYSRNPPTSTGTTYNWNLATPKPAAVVEAKYQAGMHVTHPIWGDGLVLESKILGKDEIVVVEFNSVGLKRLDAALAGLTIIQKK